MLINLSGLNLFLESFKLMTKDAIFINLHASTLNVRRKTFNVLFSGLTVQIFLINFLFILILYINFFTRHTSIDIFLIRRGYIFGAVHCFRTASCGSVWTFLKRTRHLLLEFLLIFTVTYEFLCFLSQSMIPVMLIFFANILKDSCGLFHLEASRLCFLFFLGVCRNLVMFVLI